MADETISAAEELALGFERSWNDRDGTGYGEAYWPDAELVDPMGNIWDGRTAIAQMHVDLWAGPFIRTEVHARVRRVRSLAPTIIVVDLDVDGTGFPGPPGSEGKIATRLKHVVEKRGNEWKIVASQNTFVAAV